MLKTCKYCGGLHRYGEECPLKPKARVKEKDKYTAFRNSAAWQRVREQIKDRDMHMCRACLLNLKGTIRKYNSEETEVHHIEKLSERYDLRFTESNLISLCKIHHSMSEKGEINAEMLKKIAVSDIKKDL